MEARPDSVSLERYRSSSRFSLARSNCSGVNAEASSAAKSLVSEVQKGSTLPASSSAMTTNAPMRSKPTLETLMLSTSWRSYL